MGGAAVSAALLSAPLLLEGELKLRLNGTPAETQGGNRWHIWGVTLPSRPPPPLSDSLYMIGTAPPAVCLRSLTRASATAKSPPSPPSPPSPAAIHSGPIHVYTRIRVHIYTCVYTAGTSEYKVALKKLLSQTKKTVKHNLHICNTHRMHDEYPVIHSSGF